MSGQGGGTAIAGLRALLEEIGYRALHSALCGGGLFAGDRDQTRRLAAALGPLEAACVRLFALDDPVGEEDCPSRLGEVAESLATSGLARNEAGAWRLDDLVVAPALGGLFLTATPPGWRPEHRRSGRAYLGGDSLRLAQLASAQQGAVLDLGAGCGIQGIVAATTARRVLLTDVEERSVELSALNAQLNGRQGSVEARSGDCYEPVGDERFDLIVSLPPYVPALEATSAVPTTGGPDGLALVRRILAGAEAHLTPTGELVLLAQLLCDDTGPLLVDELSELAPNSTVRVLCSEWHALQPVTLELARRNASSYGGDPIELQHNLLTALRRLGATGICTAVVRLRSGSASGAEVRVVGPSRLFASSVLAPAPGLSLSRHGALVVASTAAGEQVLSAPAAALAAAADGRRDLDEVIVSAWGDTAAAWEDVADQGYERAGELVRLGILTTT